MNRNEWLGPNVHGMFWLKNSVPFLAKITNYMILGLFLRPGGATIPKVNSLILLNLLVLFWANQQLEPDWPKINAFSSLGFLLHRRL